VLVVWYPARIQFAPVESTTIESKRRSSLGIRPRLYFTDSVFDPGVGRER
jgi:hypothetical protein